MCGFNRPSVPAVIPHLYPAVTPVCTGCNRLSYLLFENSPVEPIAPRFFLSGSWSLLSSRSFLCPGHHSLPGSGLRIFALILGPFRYTFTARGRVHEQRERRILSLCVSCRRPLCPAALAGCRHLPLGRALRRVSLRSLWHSGRLSCGRSAWAAPAPLLPFLAGRRRRLPSVCPSAHARELPLGRHPALGHPGHGACAHPQPHGQPQAVLGGSGWQLTPSTCREARYSTSHLNPDVSTQFTFPSKEVGGAGHPVTVLMCFPESS